METNSGNRRPSGIPFSWPVGPASVALDEEPDQTWTPAALRREPAAYRQGPNIRHPWAEHWASSARLVFPGLVPSQYQPMRERSLHLRFTQIDCPADALAFAKDYGFLGRIQYDDPQSECFGEPIDFWLVQAKRMRTLLLLLHIGRQPEATARALLEDCIAWMGGNFGSLIGEPENPWLSNHYIPPPGLGMANAYAGHFTKFDNSSNRHVTECLAGTSFRYSVWAQLVVADTLNAELEEGTRPVLLDVAGTPLHIMPLDLLGAMYAQLAENFMQSARPPMKCPGCGRWFTPLHGRQRMCGSRCRQRVHRARHRESRDTD